MFSAPRLNEDLISISVVIAIRQRLQVLNQISLFSNVQTQVLAGVVMINNVQQRGKAAVMIEAAFGMCPQAVERRGAVAAVRCAVGLKIYKSQKFQQSIKDMQ